jgi:hypothetical protein
MLIIDRIRFHRKTPTSEIQYDSKSDAEPAGLDPAYLPRLKELLSSEFLFRMTAQGEVSDVRVAERGAGKPEGSGMKPATALTAKLVKNLLPAMLLPEEAVSVGRTWQEQKDYPDPVRGLRKMDITYRYLRPELQNGHSVEKIALAADVRYAALSPSRISVGIKRNNCMGTVYFDKSAGRLVSKDVKEKQSLVLYEDARRTDEEIERTVAVKLQR